MIKRSAAVCPEACSCVHGFKNLKGSVAECADQNCDFVKKLNKTQFCGRNPYTGGEPRYIRCCGSMCYFCYVLLCIDKYRYI